MRKSEKLSLILLFAAFTLGFVVYPQLPSEIAVHWNSEGVADNYTQKLWGVFLMPMVMSAVFLLYKFMRQADPKQAGIEEFAALLRHFILALLIFLFYIYCLVLAWNLGYRFSILEWTLPPLSLLFIIIGHTISNIKPNWTLGIRTPWTLSNKTVWTETHRLGGIVFKLASMIILLGVIIPQFSRELLFGSILLVTIVPIGYSYWKYNQIQKNE